MHTRGVCDEDGIFFLGLGWLHTWGSGRFLGVADDAAYVAEAIANQNKQANKHFKSAV